MNWSGFNRIFLVCYGAFLLILLGCSVRCWFRWALMKAQLRELSSSLGLENSKDQRFLKLLIGYRLLVAVLLSGFFLFALFGRFFPLVKQIL